MTATTAATLRRAAAAIDAGDCDQAIDLLRADGPVNDAARCAMLARAYFRRGDAKGDVYASHWFAARARRLGDDSAEMRCIRAVGAFRKELYAEAVDSCAAFVHAGSPAALQLLYGAALTELGRAADGDIWLQRAAAARDDGELIVALDVVRRRTTAAEPGGSNMMRTLSDELRALPDHDIDSPYAVNAVSKLRGDGAAPKDFDWLRRNIPCQAACPAHTDIPGYLGAIFRGEPDLAYRINLRDNVFPGVLGRVCERPCEKMCRHGWAGLGAPVAICWSKRTAADHRRPGPVILPPLAGASGKRVAVCGAGVAGLTAARELARLGHQVVVYEKQPAPGGMLNQGIPEFRLPRGVIEAEIEQVRRQGVRIVCNTAVGTDISLAELRAGADAVVLAAGTLRPNIPSLSGNDLAGIEHGVPFLLQVNMHGRTAIGRRMLVIGGGFTAMDCARTALRLGAESVAVMYRRSVNEMLVTPDELEELQGEGIPMEFMVSPAAYVAGADGRVAGIRFVRTRLGEPDAGGRRRPVPIPGSEFEVAADGVLLATGQFPDTSWIDADLQADLVDADGWLKQDDTAATSLPDVFAAGDFATGARTLISAIGHARDCVRAVDAFLCGRPRVYDVATVADAAPSGRIREMDAVPRQPMPTLPVGARSVAAEVECGYDAHTGIEEAQRCYLCHLKYEIDNDKCIYCDWCIRAKPRPECIVRAAAVTCDESGRITGWTPAEGTEDTQLIFINQEDCIRCNACVDVCPVDCISIQRVSLEQRLPGAGDHAETTP